MPLPAANLHPMRLPVLALIGAGFLPAYGQDPAADVTGRFLLTEEVGVPLSRGALVKAAHLAWEQSFALEPGARLMREDAENGVIEGQARVNYRSRVLAAREETMGTITYQVSIQLRNGQCIVRVHDLVHRGNRDAPGGGMDIGPVMHGEAPAEHYPGLGLSTSRKLHADVRQAAGDRIREVARTFTNILRRSGP